MTRSELTSHRHGRDDEHDERNGNGRRARWSREAVVDRQTLDPALRCIAAAFRHGAPSTTKLRCLRRKYSVEEHLQGTKQSMLKRMKDTHNEDGHVLLAA